jgi:hypothetical protein
MSVYIKLFHGRTDPKQEMDSWGSAGPVFGPFDWVHVTYNTEIKLGHGSDSDIELEFDGDLVYYDGIWYGDWSVFGEDVYQNSTELQQRFQQCEEHLTKLPELVTITVSRNELGQILDGARERADLYQRTSELMNDEGVIEYNTDDEFMPAEVSSRAEAENIAEMYNRIIEKIEKQL